MNVVRHIAVLAVVTSCTPAATQERVNTDPPAEARREHVSSGFPVERLFPLVDGHIYNYAKRTTEAGAASEGDTAMLIATVARIDPSRGELRMAGSTRYFEYAKDGLQVMSAVTGARMYVLKWPPAMGERWHGEHQGKVEVTAIDQTVNVRAGSFSGCVTVVEARRGDIPARFETTFCPDVGIVALHAASGNLEEHAELVSFGPPVAIGPDGVKVFK